MWIFYIGCAYFMFRGANALWEYVFVIVLLGGGVLLEYIGDELEVPEERQNP